MSLTLPFTPLERVERSPETDAVPSHARNLPRLGDWPRASRLIPWLIAAFVVMLWLVPFDAMSLPVNLPVDSKLDRFLMLPLVGLWLGAALTRGVRSPRLSANGISGAFLAFFLLAGASLVVNALRLNHAGELDLGVKKLSLLASYGLFFYIIATSLTVREARAMVTLSIVLASLVALGTIVEFRTHTNVFYSWTAKLMPPGTTLAAPPMDPKYGRPAITGPTAHGLALCAMLAMALTLSLARVLHERERRGRWIYGLASVLIGAGALATQRKTAMVAPLAGLVVLLAYRPRAMARIAPLAVIVVVAAQFAVPGAIHNIKTEFLSFGANDSTSARAADYEGVKPDVVARPLLGRGFGTYDPHVYRFLDNQLLMLVVETGVVGALSYLFIFVVAHLKARAIVRRGPPERAQLAIGAVAAISAYVVANTLFDTLAFRQVPYLMCFMLALIVIAGKAGDHDETAITV